MPSVLYTDVHWKGVTTVLCERVLKIYYKVTVLLESIGLYNLYLASNAKYLL